MSGLAKLPTSLSQLRLQLQDALDYARNNLTGKAREARIDMVNKLLGEVDKLIAQEMDQEEAHEKIQAILQRFSTQAGPFMSNN